jgi:hypothetical protein
VTIINRTHLRVVIVWIATLAAMYAVQWFYTR